MIRKMSKCVINYATIIGLVFILAIPAFSGELASREECVAKCQEVAKIISGKGKDEAIKRLMTPRALLSGKIHMFT